MLITKNEQRMLLKIIQERNRENRVVLLDRGEGLTFDGFLSRNIRALEEFEHLTALKAKLCVEVCK